MLESHLVKRQQQAQQSRQQVVGMFDWRHAPLHHSLQTTGPVLNKVGATQPKKTQKK